MQSVYVNGGRAKYKKQLKEQVALDPSAVSLEATSIFGNEYDGPITEAPNGTYTIVGPSPHKRNWYANIIKSDDGITVR